MEKKYALFVTILTISILLTLTIVGPNAVAVTYIKAGDLLSQVQFGGTTFADANAIPDGDVQYTGTPVNVSVDWTIDKQLNGAGHHGFYLRVINLDVPHVMDEDELWIGTTGGPVYRIGILQAEVDGSAGDQIEIYIYVNVTFGGGFDEDDETWTIDLY